VTEARAPGFYSHAGVPDTAEARYEMIVLHLSLVMDRLAAAGKGGRALARALAETFVTDMDDNLREMGVGDLGVPRKVKRAAAGLYERAQRYRLALAAAAGERALEAALGEHIGMDAVAAARLADHIRRSATAVTAQPTEAVLAGRVAFAPWSSRDDR
jgi:cytochrome b pre-mRNA-processing protein 3